MTDYDFSNLTQEELIEGIKATNFPSYMRTKADGDDMRETIAQYAAMTTQALVNAGMDLEQAQDWAMQISKIDGKADQSFVDSQLSAIVSGAPKGTFTDLTALQTAYPNGTDGIFLVLENGHWYYWNAVTTAWTEGGVYQASGIADGSVTPSKTSFIDISTNLLDPKKVEFGKRYTTDNIKETNSAWNLVRLDANPSETYTVRNAVRVTIFDNAGNYYITRTRLSTETDKFTFTMGVSGKTAYITTSASTFANEQINKGSVLLSYEPFYQNLDEKINFNNGTIKKYELANKSVTEENTAFLVKGEKAFVNLYDPSYLGTQDTYVKYQDGTIASIVGRTATDFIPFPANAGYIKKKSQVSQPVVFFDKSFNFLKSDTTEQAGVVENISGYIGTSPDQTAYVKLTIFDADKNSDFIYQSAKSQLYKMPTLEDTNQNLSGKEGVAFGDSITMGATYTYAVSNYINVGFSGTRLMDIGTETPHAQLSMVYLVDAIISGDWTALDTAVASVSTEFTDALNRLKSVDFNAIDFITIFYGANDSGTVATLSNRMGAVDSTARSTWNGAINYVVEQMLTNFPHLQIYLFTPMYRTTENYITEPLADAMIVQGNRWKLPVLDLHREMGLNSLTAGTFTRDGTHPNDLGNKLLTQKIIGFLETH